jgi:hypothetical protein
MERLFMKSKIIIGALAWFLPGVGHIQQGRLKRGLILGAVIWTMFIIGILCGGAYYPGYTMKDGFLLIMLHTFACLGNGLGFLINLLFQASPAQNAAAWSTFEYGGKFLEAAGLINFLAVIDAMDIFFGRKK